MTRFVRMLFVATLALAAGGLWSGAAVAAPWCGTVSATDRPAISGGQVIRVVYATPSDGTDRSAELAPRIASEIDEIDAWWRREDSARTPRFDRYADSCGTQLDLTVVRLARVAGSMRDENEIFNGIAAELESLPQADSTKFLVYYDGSASARLCGVGWGQQEETGLAVVFLGSCGGLGSTAQTAVHELLHAFGLTQSAAPPHECPESPGHVCDSTGDVLYRYIQPAPLTSFQLDVGRDDYYRTSAGRWDLASSPWLVRVNEQVALTVAVTGTGTVRSDVPGVVCAAGSCTSSWNPNADVTLDAEPGEGQRFVRWGGACEGLADCRLLTANTTVTALFAPLTYRLAVSVNGRGTVRSTPRGVVATAGAGRAAAFTSYEPVKLLARPAKGWRLKSWSGAARGTRASVTLPMTRDAAVRAVFVPIRAAAR